MADRAWIKPTVTLCAYGFFKDMKPSEAFLTPYLNSTFKNIPKKTISDEIYPISTYSYLLFLFLVLMTTDFLRYKPLVITESLAYLVTRIILIWGQGIPIMQVMQVTYGLATATEIAYYSYIYAMVNEEHYQKVTGYTRLTVLLGKGLGDLVGQILVTTKTANYLVLNYVSLASVTIAVVVSFLLPKVDGSLFTGSVTTFEPFSNEPINEQEESNTERCVLIKQYFRKMWVTFKTSYSNKQLLKWSFWWALSMCGGLQVEDYAMNLWSNLQGPNGEKTYNGAVLACGTLFSAFFVLMFSFCKIQWSVLSELIIGTISVLQCGVIILMALTKNIWIAYVCYVIFRASFAFTLTVASYQIAIDLHVRGYGLIFGWNTLVAVCLQSILTLIVADKRGLDLEEKEQFLIYGCYFGVIALIFLASPIYVALLKIYKRCCCSVKRNRDNDRDQNNPI